MQDRFEMRNRTRRDVVLYSVGANDTHGLRRTNEDKRRAVKTMLDDAEWVTWSDNAIAKASAVSVSFVGDQRPHPMGLAAGWRESSAWLALSSG